jgi:predicted MFS family arabinose efflux permease
VGIIKQYRNYRLLLLGDFLINIGYQFYAFTVPILIYIMTDSPFAMSLMRAIEFVPTLILALFIGVMIDRQNRKKILVYTSLIQLIGIFFLIYLLKINNINLVIIYLVGFLIAIANYTRGSSIHSILPSLVPKESLPTANSQMTLMLTLTTLIGPGLAGITYGLYGVDINFTFYFIGILLFLCAALFIKIINVNQYNSGLKDRNIKNDIKEGWEELLRNKDLLRLTIVILFINFASSLSLAVLVFFGLHELGLTEQQLGYTLVGSAIGGIIGSIITKRLLKYFNTGKIFMVSFFLLTIGYSTLLFSTKWQLMFIALFLINLSTTQNNIHYHTLRQKTTPSHLLGRVSGTTATIMKLSVPLTFAIAGLAAEYIAVRYIFISTIIIVILVIVYSYRYNIYKVT